MTAMDGQPASIEQAADQRQVAVFDLDVTLTRYDTYLPFLTGYVQHNRRRALALPQLAIRLMGFWNWGDRDWMKASFLKSFLGGESRERVARWAERYADYVYQTAMRPSGLRWLHWHQKRGDRVIIASASFDVYVNLLAEYLGVDEVLATHMRWDEHDRVAGIDGRNCRDSEKLIRVQALLGGDGSGVTAYSDSHADVPLLTWAESGIAVCPSRRLTHQVAGLGLEVQHW